MAPFPRGWRLSADYPIKSRAERAVEFARALAVYERVKEELLRYPGVVEVGIGVKDRGGRLTGETAFRVFVVEKLPESVLPRDAIIPRTIGGFPTDVSTKSYGIPAIGFNDENDEKNYSTKVGGCQIGIEKDVAIGTLGCFVRPINPSDHRVFVLSAHHVLMPSGANIGVGQPTHRKSGCCVCNEIAKTVELSPADEAQSAVIDTAIAELKSKVRFAPKIRRILRADGTVEQEGTINGSGGPVLQGDRVWKVGAKSGLTYGTVSLAHPRLVIVSEVSGAVFIDFGDSGSVVVNEATSNVIGVLTHVDSLLGRSASEPTVFDDVKTTLHVDVIPTPANQHFDVSAPSAEMVAFLPATPDEVFGVLSERLKQTDEGTRLIALVHKHQEECIALVNERAAVALAWHRSRGPAWLAALMRSVREPAYRVPISIEGVTRDEALSMLGRALAAHGSAGLVADLEAHGSSILAAAVGSPRVADMIDAWEKDATLAEQQP